MDKRLRSFLIIGLVMLAAPALLAQPQAVEPAGDGTSGQPYQVSSLANLYWISQNPEHWDKHYLQTANIDASATKNWNGGEGWEPLGSTQTELFEGVYDGDDWRWSLMARL